VKGKWTAKVWVLAVSVSCPGAAFADAAAPELRPRETAYVNPELWRYSIGVFNPLTLTVARNFEIQTHPLLFLVAPNAIARVPHRAMVFVSGQWGLTGEYGLSVPTLGMRLTQGTLFPTWEHGEGQIGWIVVPRVGLVSSRVGSTLDVLTARLDLAVGFPLTDNDAQPLDAPAPLDLLFAPALGRYRTRLGVLYDYPLTPRFRVRGYGDVYVYGREAEFEFPSSLSNVTTRLGGGLDIGFGSQFDKRLHLGAAWWNADQHAIDPETFEAVRSNDIWPTLDFIWEG
jgi:hypothetical protein